MKQIAIIGGGASGLAAAVAAVEAARREGQPIAVRIFESSDRIGRPILATGNGRCNFTNADLDIRAYHNASFVQIALTAFEQKVPRGDHPNGVAAFFAEHGMLYREEGEGRMYPLANKASVVRDILLRCLDVAEVEVCTEAPITQVDVPSSTSDHFTLRRANGVFERADAVIVACGGSVARNLLPECLVFQQQHPVLCALATDTTYVRALDNIRVKAALTLRRNGEVVACEAGEALFRKYGVSGICTFNLSRYAHPGDVLSFDMLPFIGEDDVASFVDGDAVSSFAAQRLRELARALSQPVEGSDFLRGMVLPRVADVVLERCQIGEHQLVGQDEALCLTNMLKDFSVEVYGPGDVEHAQVHRGGFDVAGFDAVTLESKAIPRLYVVGEALDVDGPCGGYNLHWAFASGMLAGGHCVQ